MRGILADINVGGHLVAILGVWHSDAWREMSAAALGGSMSLDYD